MTVLLDHATLNELREALGNELDGIVQLYVDGLAEQALGLQQQLALQDLPNLRRQAHSLKGSSVSMGAQTLGQLCAEIEKLAASGSATAELSDKVGQITALAAETALALREAGWARG